MRRPAPELPESRNQQNDSVSVLPSHEKQSWEQACEEVLGASVGSRSAEVGFAAAHETFNITQAGTSEENGDGSRNTACK